MGSPQRVLHILSSTMRAGVEMTIMNLYHEVDRNKLQFDFVVHDLGKDDLSGEIESLGGRVFRVPFLRKIGMARFVGLIYDIIVQNGPYAAVHAHTDYQGGFSAMAAKKAGVAIRICHAHTDTRPKHSPAMFAKRLIGRVIIRRYATLRCACSKNAGAALYGKRAVRKGRVKIINNSIDLSQFRAYPPQTRERLLKDCKADKNTRIIGYVGRLNAEKNPSFFLDMAAEAKKRGLDYRFVFVGTGVMLEKLMSKTNSQGLENHVFFLGTRSDVPYLMQCFDLVVVPSFTEGFSLAAAESQAAGTPVLAASCVPREADMGLNLLHLMRLNAGAKLWIDKAQAIMETTIRPGAQKRINALKAKGFDAKSNVNIFMSLYGLDTAE